MGIVVPYVDRAFGIVCCVVAFLFRILGKMIVLREKIDMYHLINGYSLK